jgi:hypothetical protein
MNVPLMAHHNPATNLMAIQKFERQRSIELPPSYKKFLLLTNGGVPETSAFPISNFDESSIGVMQIFLGIGVEHPTSELAYAYDLYAGGIPEGIVPIASNGGGDYICLDLRKVSDRVAFWDKNHFWSTGEWRERDLYPVADTFEQFLTSLRPNPY